MVDNGFNKRLFGVWLILVAISLAYLWIDHAATHQGIPTASTVVTVVAICFALIKVRIIMREFMEVRTAPRCFAVSPTSGSCSWPSPCSACISPERRWRK